MFGTELAALVVVSEPLPHIEVIFAEHPVVFATHVGGAHVQEIAVPAPGQREGVGRALDVEFGVALLGEPDEGNVALFLLLAKNHTTPRLLAVDALSDRCPPLARLAFLDASLEFRERATDFFLVAHAAGVEPTYDLRHRCD